MARQYAPNGPPEEPPEPGDNNLVRRCFDELVVAYFDAAAIIGEGSVFLFELENRRIRRFTFPFEDDVVSRLRKVCLPLRVF